MWLVLSWSADTQQNADEKAARALCAVSVGSPELIAPCVTSTLATMRFNRRMNLAR